jgi:ribosome silencing factor RsfS/YbeB/iojap
MSPTKPTTTKRRAAQPSSGPKAGAAKKRAPRRKAAAPARPALIATITAALDDLKAQNVTVLDVRKLTDVTDTIVIASGTSDRHVKSLAGSVYEKAKQAGFRPIGIEGEQEGEWVLVDLQDAIVHVMLPRVREFYGLEKLWDVRDGARALESREGARVAG